MIPPLALEGQALVQRNRHCSFGPGAKRPFSTHWAHSARALPRLDFRPRCRFELAANTWISS
eukprot:11872284-Alexandrium_andersonii.AAC.1